MQLGRLAKLLAEKKITIGLDQPAKEFLVDLGYSPAYGARPLKRVIDTYVGDRISEMIISGKVEPDQHINVGMADKSLTFEVG